MGAQGHDVSHKFHPARHFVHSDMMYQPFYIKNNCVFYALTNLSCAQNGSEKPYKYLNATPYTKRGKVICPFLKEEKRSA